MKRFHVHLSVPDLAEGIRFYSGVFGAAPSVAKPDYAKWMIDDPRVNFAISQRTARTGLEHLGFEAEDAGELADIRERFDAARAGAVEDEPGARCCYAVSDKHWVTDPAGVAWEAFHTLGAITRFGEEHGEPAAERCCDAAGPDDASDASAVGCCGAAVVSSAKPAGAARRCCA